MKQIEPHQLKKQIEESGYTVSKILKLAGVTDSAFSKWLNGKSTINVESYNKIVNAYNELRSK